MKLRVRIGAAFCAALITGLASFTAFSQVPVDEVPLSQVTRPEGIAPPQQQSTDTKPVDKTVTTITTTQTTPTPPKPRRLWNLKDVDIRTVVHAVAEETGKNFVIDPRVTGKVTFISTQPLNAEELYQAFLSVLQVNGFAALPNNKVIKIVPDYVARGLSSPIYADIVRKEGDSMAVSVVGIKYVPVNELASALNQFLTPSGHIAAYAPSNDLIIADRSGNIVHLMRLIQQIDQQRASRIQVIHLRNAQAKVLVETLKSILGPKASSAGAGQSSTMQMNIAADERTNSILLSGGIPEQSLQVRAVIANLDISNSMPGSVTEVIYLKHLHAERMAVVVNALIQNFLEKARSALPGGGTGTSPQGSGQYAPVTSGGGGESTGASGSSSLFNAQLGSSSANPSTMYSTTSGFFTSNTQNNDINSIVDKAPKSGSVSPAVQWEESTNSLIVTAPRDVMRKVRQVLYKLDIRRPQVLIEAVIAEVSEVRQKELGIQWNPSGSVSFQTSFLPELPLSIIGLNGRLATTAAQDTVGQGLSLTYNGNQIRLLIAALETDNDSNVLATPNLLTLDNEAAQIKVGTKVPFATAQIQNNPTGGNPYSFFDREDVGLILTVSPQITPNGAIKLLIQQELSAVVPGTTNASVGGNPTTTERFIRTTVMADNGRILVLGGLLQDQWNQGTSQVPWIGNLPYLGALFRDRAKTINKTNLMIFLRPTILYSERDDDRVSGGKYEFLRQNQLKLDLHNPFRKHYQAPVMPVEGEEVHLPAPFPPYPPPAAPYAGQHQLVGAG